MQMSHLLKRIKNNLPHKDEKSKLTITPPLYTALENVTIPKSKDSAC